MILQDEYSIHQPDKLRPCHIIINKYLTYDVIILLKQNKQTNKIKIFMLRIALSPKCKLEILLWKAYYIISI